MGGEITFEYFGKELTTAATIFLKQEPHMHILLHVTL